MRKAVLSTIDTIDKKVHESLVNEDAQKQTLVDTFLKWAPFALLITYDAYGIKTRNNYKQHLLQMVAGQVMLNVAIQPLKKLVNRIRPNGKSKSFPSAHTATGFLASEIIHQELRENSAALKHSGYALSIITGWLRLYRNKHWFSDVVGGALIGVLFGKISSRLIENLKENN